jgi:16S rRNA (guanine527-N7)-methyltransferase
MTRRRPPAPPHSDRLERALDERLDDDLRRALPAEAFARLVAFGTLLLTHNQRANLVGPLDERRAADELLADSLELLPLLHALPALPAAAIDIGTGAGIPGIPLAIATPSVAWLLVEPREKRMLFLQHAKRALALDNVTLLRDRLDTPPSAELVGHGATLAVSRAVLAPEAWVAAARPLVGPDGFVAVWRNGAAPRDAARTRTWHTSGDQPRHVALIGARASSAASHEDDG